MNGTRHSKRKIMPICGFGRLAIAVVGAICAIHLVKADLGDDIRQIDVLNVRRSATICAASLDQVIEAKSLADRCPEANVFYYYRCCSGSASCCFRPQDWLIVTIVVITVLTLICMIVGCIRCLCCL